MDIKSGKLFQIERKDKCKTYNYQLKYMFGKAPHKNNIADFEENNIVDNSISRLH
jgi:hypothetical protein